MVVINMDAGTIHNNKNSTIYFIDVCDDIDSIVHSFYYILRIVVDDRDILKHALLLSNGNMLSNQSTLMLIHILISIFS